MPPRSALSKLSIRQFAERFKAEMIPLSNTFSYFCASVPMTEQDLKEYLEEPVAALPQAIAGVLPKISILLVPYLERANGRDNGKPPSESAYVSVEKPPEGRMSSSTHIKLGDETVMAFALKDQEVTEYHYRFYHLLSTVLSEHWSEEIEVTYCRILREELTADVHGEVDEQSWRMKQSLRRGKAGGFSGRDHKAFRAYARQSFADTLTL